MRRSFLMLVLLITTAALFAGCIVHPRGPRAPRRGGRCHTTCGEWAHRTSCVRQCSTYRNGHCVRYRKVCSRKRYCKRNVTRCR